LVPSHSAASQSTKARANIQFIRLSSSPGCSKEGRKWGGAQWYKEVEYNQRRNKEANRKKEIQRRQKWTKYLFCTEKEVASHKK
jgi:hypothetical protein